MGHSSLTEPPLGACRPLDGNRQLGVFLTVCPAAREVAAENDPVARLVGLKFIRTSKREGGLERPPVDRQIAHSSDA